MMRVHSHAELQRQMAAAQAGDTVGRTSTNKFGAVRTVTEQGKFDSRHEADWAHKLMELQRAGYIEDVIVDKRALMYALDVNGVRIAQYEADAKFTVLREFPMPTFDGERLLRIGLVAVLDAKSPPTRKKSEFVMKRNLMFALYNIKLLEV